MTYIIVFGSPVEGFSYCGPFESHEDALDYAEDHRETSWWIAELSEAD